MVQPLGGFVLIIITEGPLPVAGYAILRIYPSFFDSDTCPCAYVLLHVALESSTDLLCEDIVIAIMESSTVDLRDGEEVKPYKIHVS